MILKKSRQTLFLYLRYLNLLTRSPLCACCVCYLNFSQQDREKLISSTPVVYLQLLIESFLWARWCAPPQKQLVVGISGIFLFFPSLSALWWRCRQPQICDKRPRLLSCRLAVSRPVRREQTLFCANKNIHMLGLYYFSPVYFYMNKWNTDTFWGICSFL